MGSTSFTNPYASEVIRSRRGELVRGIAHTERLLELLISQGVLQEDSRGVMSGLSGAEERNAQLLSLLLARGERACRAFFYPCLKRAQPDLYCRVRSYVGGLKDARRQLIGYLLEKDRRGLREETRRGACPVRDAVCAGDLCVLQELTTGLDVNATPSPLLHLAARHGRESIVYFLLRKGAWPDRADHQGRTALHVAAQKGQTGVVRALVRAGADVHATDREGQTALQLAARHAHHETVSALREGRSLTPLSHQVGGVCEVKPELMECLNQSDTDVDGRTEPGQDTEISIADEARTLLDKGQDPASQGPEVVTPPHLAVTQGGFTALHQANTEGVAQLQERQGGAALHWASAGGHTRLVKLLLDTGADANAPDRERRTPLHLAAAHGHAHIITQLLAGGAKRGARDRHGSSPLHHAARNGHREAAEVLLASCGGASVDERNIWRRSALHLAAQHGRDTLVELLLENRAHINCLDGNRDTPLHCACRAGHLGAAQRLIGWCRGQRANLRATNAVKKSALQVAEGGDTPTHRSISTLLKKKMLLVK